VKEPLRSVLSAYEPQVIAPRAEWKEAAVLAVIYEHNGRPHLVFQRRTDHVEDHKGQISLPGGAFDPGDSDLRVTALRETHEEIGVHPDHIDVLGRIDDLVTISNYRVTPYVGWLSHYPYDWRFNAHEVAYLLEVPLEHLLDPANLVPDERVINGRQVVLPSYRFGEDLIWGATARMVTNLLDLVNAARG
jgi:8-oxo-dGTP pyrophosphatase MutT (NUDIX family)